MRVPRGVFIAGAVLCMIGAGFSLWRGGLLAELFFLLAAGLLGFAAWTQRGPAPHTPWSPELAQPGRAVVFWKDGCPYCHRLLRAIGADPRVTWVNVYRDKAADAEVRELNGGDQLTPTALVGRAVLKNPTAAELREALG